MSTARRNPKPTIRDVAEHANVSKGLVSLALRNPEKVSDVRRTRIFNAVEELGYQPNFLARSLAVEHSSFIGILVADLYNPTFSDVANAARAKFEESQMHSLITSVTPEAPEFRSVHQPRQHDTRLLQMFTDLRPSGILVVGSIPSDLPLPEKTPTVFASAIPPEDTPCPSVRVDEQLGYELLFRHLLDRGRRRIAFVGGQEGAVSRAREKAYRKLSAQHNMPPQVFGAINTEDSGYKAGLQLLKSDLSSEERPDAVIAVNDLAAIGVLHAADELGIRVPAELSVTGVDNNYLAALNRISLTTLDPNNEHIGHEAAKLLMNREIRDPAVENLITPELVIRSTS